MNSLKFTYGRLLPLPTTANCFPFCLGGLIAGETMEKDIQYHQVWEVPPPGQANDTAGPQFQSPGYQDPSTSQGHGIDYVTSPGSATRAIESFFHLFLNGVFVVLPIVGLAVWLGYHAREGGPISISSAVIGGRLTQEQAKAIDFVASALLAPFLLIVFDYVWFSGARVTAFNERDSSLPLATLVEISHTNSGSYDILKVSSLLRGGTLNTFLFAVLVVISAITRTAFSNIIAYEAYEREYPGTSTPMASLVQKGWAITNNTFSAYDDYNLTNSQLADFGSEAISILTAVSYRNASNKLTDGAYVAINATKSTLNGLSSNVVDMQDVPGYRMTMDCKAQKPTLLSLINSGASAVQMSVSDGWGLYFGQYPGQLDVLINAHTMNLSFVGFYTDKKSLYMVNVAEGNATKPCSYANGTAIHGPGCDPWAPIASPYGEMDYGVFNLTGGFTKSVRSAWGMNCTMYRETGSHSLARQADLSWSITSSTWSGTKEPALLMISDWQTILNFHSPSSQIPGLGGAFYPSSWSNITTDTDYKTYVETLLYAAAEMEHTMYQVKNAGAKADGDDSADTFYVPTVMTELVYRITYVPLILLVGLIALFIAALVPFAQLIRSMRLPSMTLWREINALRLVMDSLAVHPSETDVHNTRGASNKEIRSAAGDTKVAYVPATPEPGWALHLRRKMR
ncbi:hypothetical protein GGR57DRAFT_484271 [Xylariaceae sp. FL1272]|nr:hypothetical protein GGR57DRAFT_484271 [Xylariaceae sp. FL1272]